MSLRALLVLPLLALPGCWHGKSVDARVDLKGKRLLIIPFAQGERLEFDSRTGRDLAERIGTLIAQAAPKRSAVIDSREAERLLPAVRDRGTDWLKLGRALKADLLLLGEIREHRLRDKGQLTSWRGTLVLDYRVVDAATGAVAISVPGRTFHFPEDNSQINEDFNYGADPFTDPDRLARGLLESAARAVAWEFLDHEEPVR